MRKLLIIIAVLFQIVFLALIAFQREMVIRNGRTVYLCTIPVDPIDPFRGEYIRVNYEIADTMRQAASEVLKDANKENKRDVLLYTVLDVDENQVAHAKYVTDIKPKGEFFIRGRADLSVWDTSIRYGIEAYFVEQGQGREIERMTRLDNNARMFLEMEAAIGSNGIAVLKGYRLGRLSIGTELEKGVFGITGAKVVFRNISDSPLAIVDLPEGMSMSLEQAFGWNGKDKWQWVNADKQPASPQDKDVRILQPDEQYAININFNDADWFVKRSESQPRSLSSLNEEKRWGYTFRLIYKPPSRKECEHLENAALIWHGQLSSQTFGTSVR